MPSNWLLLLTLMVAACASGPARPVAHPQATADKFAAALRDNDPTSAYGLLDKQTRQQVDEQRFAQMWSDSRQELLATLQQPGDATPESQARAAVMLEDNNQVSLVLEQGRWKLTSGVVDAYSLATPVDAVLALRQALQRQSLPGMLRVLSRQHRAAWLAAFEQSIDATADPLDLEVEINGDEAIVRTSDQTTIVLLRENGQWHIREVK